MADCRVRCAPLSRWPPSLIVQPGGTMSFGSPLPFADTSPPFFYRLLPLPASQTNHALSRRRRAVTLSSCAITLLQTLLVFMRRTSWMSTTPALAPSFENAGVIAVLFAQFHPLLCFSSDTALLLSSCQGHPEICRLLVVSGADVNAKLYSECSFPWGVHHIRSYDARLCMRI